MRLERARLQAEPLLVRQTSGFSSWGTLCGCSILLAFCAKGWAARTSKFQVNRQRPGADESVRPYTKIWGGLGAA